MTYVCFYAERASERTNGAQTCASKGAKRAAETLELWPLSPPRPPSSPALPLERGSLCIAKAGWDKLKKWPAILMMDGKIGTWVCGPGKTRRGGRERV